MSSEVMRGVRPIAVAALTFTVCLAGACSKDQGSSATTAAAAKANTPSPFERHSARIIEGVEAQPTGTARNSTDEAEANMSEDFGSVSVSTDATPDTGGAPLTVTFVAEVEGGPPGLRYRWDFGDNSPLERQLKAEHTYQTPGDYTATFTVIGPDIEETREESINVTEDGFDLDIEADPDIGPAPLTVRFGAVLDEDLPGPLRFQWSFGDGGRDVSAATTHTYRLPGAYTAALTVTNPQGQKATREVEIQVDPREDDSAN